MRNLWDILNESILDDEEEIMSKIDKQLLHPFEWLHEESLKCNNWDQLYKILKQFYSVISAKTYSAELQSKVPAPKSGGIYQYYWDLKSYKYSKNDLLCRFNFDINDPGISTHKNDLLYLGFAKSEGMALNIDRQKVTWRILGKDKIRNVLVKRDSDKVFYINPDSSFYSEYKAMADELGLK